MKTFFTHLTNGTSDLGMVKAVEVGELARALEEFWAKKCWGDSCPTDLLEDLGLERQPKKPKVIEKLDPCTMDLMHRKLNELIDAVNRLLEK